MSLRDGAAPMVLAGSAFFLVASYVLLFRARSVWKMHMKFSPWFLREAMARPYHLWMIRFFGVVSLGASWLLIRLLFS